MSDAAADRAFLSRRRFLKTTAAAATLPMLGSLPGRVFAVAADKPPTPPESLVKTLYDSLTPDQRNIICFGWNHVDKKRGLLRTRIENNWTITPPAIRSSFYTKDQQDNIRAIFEGMTNPDWRDRWDKQLKDDVGGFGNRQSIAIFGTPGTKQFEFVLASRHMTQRCDGNSADHVAFGGPILYAHEGMALREKPDHPNNVFWYQALEANKLFQTLDGKHKEKALILKGMPTEELVAFRGKGGDFPGVPIADLSRDQKDEVSRILMSMLEPFRKSDQDEALECLKKQGGLDHCSLAFYKEGDLGDDGIYDNWRIEGPSFVWYFRGKPHVHVWVNIADDSSVKLNSYQNSIM